MEFVCTICCKEKRTDTSLLPAIDRYLSTRIAFAYDESRRLGRPMLILSGKYGLLRPEDPIPWYDQKLVMEAVPEIVPVIASRLTKLGVSHIIFYCRTKTDLDWRPYHAALEQACQMQNVEITFRFLDLE
jgi:hypothetical protein